jgi:hypothetical protein
MTVMVVVGVGWLCKVFTKKIFCPKCYRAIPIEWYGQTCSHCGGRVSYRNGKDLYYDGGGQSVLVFEDDKFWSKYLLLTPPNDIQILGETFRDKIFLILRTLDNDIFKLTTKMTIEDVTYFPEIHLVQGKIRYVIKGFLKEHLQYIKSVKYCFWEVL